MTKQTSLYIANHGSTFSLYPQTEAMKPLLPGQVRIQIMACGINRADLLQCHGKYPPPSGTRDIPGLEVSGIVVEVASHVKRWQPGDRVLALLPGEGYSTSVSIDETQVMALPTDLSFTLGAALPEVLATVWHHMIETDAFQPGKTILLHGGSSGIGSTAIQIARWRGCRVLATARGREKAEFCIQQGASAVIDLNAAEQEWHEKAVDLAPEGIHAIIDILGGSMTNQNLKALAPRGILIQIASILGSKAEIALPLLMSKQLTIRGAVLRNLPFDEKERILKAVESKLLPLVTAGLIRPHIERCRPLQEAEHLLKDMSQRSPMGKWVLKSPSLTEHT